MDAIPDDVMKTAIDAIHSDADLHIIVARAIASERERCASAVDDFRWTLPLYGEKPNGFTAADVNMLTDDCACSVQEQIAAAIRRGTPPCLNPIKSTG